MPVTRLTSTLVEHEQRRTGSPGATVQSETRHALVASRSRLLARPLRSRRSRRKEAGTPPPHLLVGAALAHIAGLQGGGADDIVKSSPHNCRRRG